MTNQKTIFVSIETPIRKNPSFEERLRGYDKGCILAWELGRSIQITDSSYSSLLIDSFKRDELPRTGFKGGFFSIDGVDEGEPSIEPKTSKKNQKEYFGATQYLAYRMGVLGMDLEINLSEIYEFKCSKTGRTRQFKILKEGDSI